MLNTLTIGVLERTREIGMIPAVGATRRQIRDMVVTEALLLAAIGATFGILGGVYLGNAIVIGLLLGVLAATIPARQAARLEVVQALRYE